MVKYPHTIVITIKTDPVQSGASWIAGSSSRKTYKCRAESNGSGGQRVGADGAVYNYSYTAYMERTTDIIPRDALYSLTMGSLVVTGTVKDASNGQLNSRIWL